jgi:hypothetical protein
MFFSLPYRGGISMSLFLPFPAQILSAANVRLFKKSANLFSVEFLALCL